MPLPPTLAAKLAKRGLIAPKQKFFPDSIKKPDFKGVSTCPNKNNPYHDCTVWCESHWKGVPAPDPKYVRNMQKLLVKYPLPNNWTEIFDKGVGRYYYWNMENDLVTWLPPKHPKAVVTKSAAKLREKKKLEQKDRKEKDDFSKRDRTERESRSSERDSEDEERSYKSKHSERRDRDRDEKRSKRDRDDHHKRDRDKRKREEPLDPMDPAAYSDVPQGTWSDGLETNKARADNTASGVLFQQRPYPAPGAVLAANKEKEDKERRK
ncbi:hypothetical protein ABEB36_008046 [Hypothenemus hampei]|uniref:Polyglutamine-binding protein 1 n=1 Tax=Hypothenemus hampei TaxID=57062 RepID=A0ABD1EKJ3_HYPHA